MAHSPNPGALHLDWVGCASLPAQSWPIPASVSNHWHHPRHPRHYHHYPRLCYHRGHKFPIVIMCNACTEWVVCGSRLSLFQTLAKSYQNFSFNNLQTFLNFPSAKLYISIANALVLHLPPPVCLFLVIRTLVALIPNLGT